MKVVGNFKHIHFAVLQNNKNPAGYTLRITQITEIDKNGIEITGSHEEGLSNRDVVGVLIDNQPQLNKFPRGFGRIFPNLRYIQVNRCSISILKREDFSDVGNLQGLWLSENFIEALPGDLFVNVQGLQYLSFHKNKLKYISADLLTPLKNLRFANFEDNTLINVNYKDNPEELLKLLHEIKTKCAYSINMEPSKNVSLDGTIDLVNRVIFLETEIKKLQIANNEKDTRIKSLEDTVETLTSDMNMINQSLKPFEILATTD